MLVPPSGDHSVPPKLPPRDFVAKRVKSKSSSNVNNSFGEIPQMDQMLQPNCDGTNENIYSTRDELNITSHDTTEAVKIVRKTKKNRFLESLKAPLELAKSSRSASVMGAPTGVASNKVAANQKSDDKLENPTPKKASSKTKRNLRSFLGVGSK